MISLIRSAAVTAAAVTCFAITASAVPVDNFSFEVPDVDPFAYNPSDSTASGTGWDYSGGAGITQQQVAFAGDANGGYLATDGTQLGFLQGNSEIAQNLAQGTSVGGAEYLIEFDAAGRTDNLTAGAGGTPSAGELSVRITDVGGGNEMIVSPFTPIPVGPEGDDPAAPKDLYSFAYTFTNPESFGSGGFRLRFLHQPAATGGDVSTIIDNVRVTQVIPEPASLALLGLGGLGLLRRRRTA